MSEAVTPGVDMMATEAGAAVGEAVNRFTQQHECLDVRLRAHLLAVAGADFGRAVRHLARWRRSLDRHIAIEETHLLPHVPEGARWAARVYRLEHRRIEDLAHDYAAKVQAVAARPPQGRRATREAVLALLDGAHSLRHVIEHHHEREQMALAVELTPEVQEAAWRMPAAAPADFSRIGP